jgi:hypothetical protein
MGGKELLDLIGKMIFLKYSNGDFRDMLTQTRPYTAVLIHEKNSMDSNGLICNTVSCEENRFNSF